MPVSLGFLLFHVVEDGTRHTYRERLFFNWNGWEFLCRGLFFSFLSFDLLYVRKCPLRLFKFTFRNENHHTENEHKTSYPVWNRIEKHTWGFRNNCWYHLSHCPSCYSRMRDQRNWREKGLTLTHSFRVLSIYHGSGAMSARTPGNIPAHALATPIHRVGLHPFT